MIHVITHLEENNSWEQQQQKSDTLNPAKWQLLFVTMIYASEKPGDKAHSLLKPSQCYNDYGSRDHLCISQACTTKFKTTAAIWRTRTFIITIMWTTGDLIHDFPTLLSHFFRTSLLAARQPLMSVPHGDTWGMRKWVGTALFQIHTTTLRHRLCKVALPFMKAITCWQWHRWGSCLTYSLLKHRH